MSTITPAGACVATSEFLVSGKAPRSGSAASHPIFETLKADFHVVSADIRKRGVRRAVGGTLEGLESFYLTDDDRQRLAQLHGLRRLLRRVWWLAKGLLMKLTPARRMLLAIALGMLVLGFLSIGQERIALGRVQIAIRLPALVPVLLLVVLMLELKDKLAARDELEAGRAVQLALMPGQTPDVPGWDVWLYTQPANDVGGDLVDHLKIDEQRHFVALGDVAGKALPAALLSVKLQATLRALAPKFDDLGSLGASVNHILQRDGLPTRFASLIYLLIRTDSGRVRLLNAGHMPPFVVRGIEVTQMERGSMVLGMMPDATFEEQALTLETGDTLVVYSDGISEAMNEAGDFFGDERLLAIVQKTAGLPVPTIGDRVIADVADFVGHAVPSDDVSLVVVRRR